MGGGLGEMQRDVYGLRIAARGDWPEVVEALDRDFAWFPQAGSEQPDASVRIVRGAPDRARYGALEAVAITWRSAVFRDGGRTIVDYGRAISVEDDEGLTIEGVHGWTVWRAAYEFLLGRIDAHVDGLGLARVNGLGLAGRHGGVLVLLPSGGGKTTLTLRALASGGVGLVSEGSPLLDARGRLHPFPLPLLVRTSSADHPDLPGAEHLRTLAGIDPDPITVEVSAFRDAVPDGPVPLRHVVLGVRTLGGTAALEPLARRAATADLARATVGGFGILAGDGLLAAPRRLWTTRGRLAAFARALTGTRVWRLTLGPDTEANWHALARVL
jgi:hypothetical protein